MRILMLGWEFPPFISGGLGTACYGLTRGLDRMGHEVVFVLPRPVEHAEEASHVRLLSPAQVNAGAALLPLRRAGETGQWRSGGEWRTQILAGAPGAPGSPGGAAPGALTPSPPHEPAWLTPEQRREFRRALFYGVPAGFSSPYARPADAIEAAPLTPALRALPPEARSALEMSRRELHGLLSAGVDISEWEAWARWVEGDPGAAEPLPGGRRAGDYSGDLFAEAGRYARLCLRLARQERFDVVHAHDWLTFPAGIAVAQATGKPLVIHIHATEFDRSGEHVNQRVYDIERRGMHAATRVCCVSELTKRICIHRYGADARRVRVVYNGIDLEEQQPQEGAAIEAGDKIVLFLGRITMQKGPEYFIHAAKRVLDVMDGVKFVVAGSGDMATRMIELAAKLGIGHKVLFTGFLRGRDVQRVFEMADLFVMPSVSEPFGIAPLEAIAAGAPVIISKQSGVSEVLTHALKVDFWDTEEMANKIVAVLRHPPLSHTLSEHGSMEIRRLTWDGAAQKCVRVYNEALDEMRRV